MKFSPVSNSVKSSSLIGQNVLVVLAAIRAANDYIKTQRKAVLKCIVIQVI